MLRIVILIVAFFALTTNTYSEEPSVSPDLSHPTQSFYSAPLDRLSSGFVNVVTSPLELINQPREELKRADFFPAIIPGIVRGIGWFGVRLGVGIFEIVTFPVPWKPHLDRINLDWLSL
ncbi:MAG: exosortase system-associated protein, TIGR04073 family [Candidatus Omnitrophica bacterium]|nr:exosortase system-associated protein, TIGR04073 family [Candidatus Omnitrophota bacterium]